MTNVPCGSCRLCCQSLMVPLHPEHGDDPSSYITATLYAPGKPPQMILDRHSNGDCVYLNENGCTIHDRAPWVCREFDCRTYFKEKTRNERRELIKKDNLSKGLFDRGKELLECG
jgi:Fe-S-cluster containining protein